MSASMMSRMKSRPAPAAAVSFAIKILVPIAPVYVAHSGAPAKPGDGSDLADSPLGFYRSGDGIEGGDGVEHLTHQNRIGRAAGDRVGEGFEIGADRVNRREA